jgi:hypothetical protein
MLVCLAFGFSNKFPRKIPVCSNIVKQFVSTWKNQLKYMEFYTSIKQSLDDRPLPL